MTQGGGAERWLVRSRDKCDIVAAADYGTDMFKTRWSTSPLQKLRRAHIVSSWALKTSGFSVEEKFPNQTPPILKHFDLQDLSLTILLTIEQKIIFGLVLVGLKGYLPSIGEARSCKSGIDTRGGDWGVGWMIAHSIKRQMRESLVIIEPAPIHSMDGDQRWYRRRLKMQRFYRLS